MQQRCSNEGLRKDSNRSVAKGSLSSARECELAAGKTLAFGFGTCATFFCRLRFFARCQSHHRKRTA